MKTFVSAVWSDLVLLSYAVPEELLTPYIGPYDLDRWDGKAYISIVGFHFGRTRILGLGAGPLVPAVANFAQWNLRAYVRTPSTKPGDSPGVVFIKEFVPSPLVTGLVRCLYN